MKAAISGLASLGLAVSQPRATLYTWVKAPKEWDSKGFAVFLLENAGVSVAPGSFFGEQGESYVRISVTSPEERIAEAFERIRPIMGESPVKQ